MISLIKKIFKGKITLHSACAKGDIETVKQCLASGANVNEINNDDYGCREAPLHTAACENQKECAVLLILKGADINIQDNKGKTPLDWAEEEKNSEISELLRKHGAKSLKEIDPDLFESNIKEEKARYDVILTTRGGNKISVIKAVREINKNLSLAEAKEIVESFEPVLLEGVTKKKSIAAKDIIRNAGGHAELRTQGK